MRGTSHPKRSTVPFAHAFRIKFALDASGDLTGNVTSDGVTAKTAAVTHNSTGNYTVALLDKWPGGLAGLNVTIIKATPPDAVPFLLEDGDTSVKASDPTLEIGFMDTSNNLKNPVSCTILIEGTFKQQTGV